MTRESDVYCVSGVTSFYKERGRLMAFISRYGITGSQVFGPVIDKDITDSGRSAYSFAFMTYRLEEEQINLLENIGVAHLYLEQELNKGE